MQIITSTQNKRIKERAKLLKKKERDQTGCFLIEGSHMIQEALRAQVLDELYVVEGSSLSIDFPQIICTQPVINRLSQQKSDAKYIGVCHKKINTEKDVKRVLLLDDVQDPGNVGTIFRTAYSFGYDKIFLSKHCADVYNPKTIQSMCSVSSIYSTANQYAEAFLKALTLLPIVFSSSFSSFASPP